MVKEAKISKARLWTSYILQGIVVLLFLMGSFGNIMQSEDAVSSAVQLGYPEKSVLYLGIVLLISTLLFAIPRTSFFGALFLTGWLGGAIATHVIHGDPVFSYVLPMIFGTIIWLSLWLRNDKLQKLIGNN